MTSKSQIYGLHILTPLLALATLCCILFGVRACYMAAVVCSVYWPSEGVSHCLYEKAAHAGDNLTDCSQLCLSIFSIYQSSVHSVGRLTFCFACSSTFLSNHRPEEELNVFADGVKYSAKWQVRGERKKRRKGETEL